MKLHNDPFTRNFPLTEKVIHWFKPNVHTGIMHVFKDITRGSSGESYGALYFSGFRADSALMQVMAIYMFNVNLEKDVFQNVSTNSTGLVRVKCFFLFFNLLCL